MDSLIAFCGLDCAQCDAYQATQAGDEAAKRVILEKWREEFDAPGMPLAVVTCDGCTSSGRLGGYCSECLVHNCGRSKGVANCAYCDEFETCETLLGFIANITGAQENLAAIRAGM